MTTNANISSLLTATEAELQQTQELQRRALAAAQNAEQQILFLQGRIAALKELLPAKGAADG